MQPLLGISALILNLIGYVPYIRDILRNRVKPHRITWGVWAILTTIAAVNQVINGGGYSSLFFISTAFVVGITFLLSIRYGTGGASQIDRICLFLALVLFVYWVTVRDTRTSTVLAVAIDAIGAIPTIVKIYYHPETETYIQWSLAGIAGIFTMLAVPRFDWVLLIYPLYVPIMNGIIVGLKFIRER